jgi:Tol biopolymer transport system component
VQLTDLVTGVSRPVPGADRFSRHPLSADNRLVVFLSPLGTATVSDLVTGTTRALSAKATGGVGNSTDGAPSITPSGRYAVFASLSTNLVPIDTLGFAQIYRVPVRVA